MRSIEQLEAGSLGAIRRELAAAIAKLHDAAVAYADALTSEQPKTGWDEVQAMESAAIAYRDAKRKVEEY